MLALPLTPSLSSTHTRKRACIRVYYYTQAVIHGNTVTALKSLRGVDVKVFSKEEGVATAMDALGVTVEREFETNPFGTPVLRSMFQVLERQSQAVFVGYVSVSLQWPWSHSPLPPPAPPPLSPSSPSLNM